MKSIQPQNIFLLDNMKNFKKTNSLYIQNFEQNPDERQKYERTEDHVANQSSFHEQVKEHPQNISEELSKRTKNQKVRKISILNLNEELGKEITLPNLSDLLHSKIKNRESLKGCQICYGDNKNSDNPMAECPHSQIFCLSCLHHYVIYKVSSFQQVRCPSEGCDAILDSKGKFFTTLPIDIQSKYKKIHLYYEQAKDTTKKLCPSQNCQGLIELQEDKYMLCSICSKQYCPKCLLQSHEGQCDQYELDFFKNNLHYRQCKKCQVIIEKNEGCNHMTCRCGYQFCYVCSFDWSPLHYNNHDVDGNILPIMWNPDSQSILEQNIEPFYDCSHFSRDYGSTMGSILKFILKSLLFIGLFIFMILFFILIDLLIAISMFLISLVAGLLCYSTQIIMKLDKWMILPGILVFPAFMILGLIKSFRELFWRSVPMFFSSFKYSFGVWYRSIEAI